VPQLWVWLGLQGPSPAQADQGDQVPVAESQVRVCVPQLPQAWVAAPAQLWLPHGCHLQSPPHDWVPPLPQLWDWLGAHTPSPAQVDHGDQVPVAESQVRVWVPHLPQPWEAAPAQARTVSGGLTGASGTAVASAVAAASGDTGASGAVGPSATRPSGAAGTPSAEGARASPLTGPELGVTQAPARASAGKNT
jgi:hypothetical protein